jgi:hypothetical protein
VFVIIGLWVGVDVNGLLHHREVAARGDVALSVDGLTGVRNTLDPHATVRPLLDDVTISNGLAWTDDAATMYYIDTRTQRVDAFDYDLETGEIRNRRPVVEIPEGDGGPDGMTIDVDGCLWVALFRGGAVLPAVLPAGIGLSGNEEPPRGVSVPPRPLVDHRGGAGGYVLGPGDLDGGAPETVIALACEGQGAVAAFTGPDHAMRQMAWVWQPDASQQYVDLVGVDGGAVTLRLGNATETWSARYEWDGDGFVEIIDDPPPSTESEAPTTPEPTEDEADENATSDPDPES